MEERDPIGVWQEKYPLCFKNKCSYGLDFRCGDGWIVLIDTLFSKIENHLRTCDADANKDFVIEQIKEKFGSLRFYAMNADMEIYEMINEAEAESSKTCDECGAAGVLSIRQRWYKTLCSSCQEKLGYEVCKNNSTIL
jgi:hypothetical protein